MYNPYQPSNQDYSYSPYKNDNTTTTGYNVPTYNSNYTV